jgi:hypothetical protein
MSALNAYEAALELTERMLVCAREARWDQLVELEKERGGLIESLGRADADPARDTAARDGKRRILERMIACDEEISTLTQDWMAELRQILNSVDTSNKLERTYSVR